MAEGVEEGIARGGGGRHSQEAVKGELNPK